MPRHYAPKGKSASTHLCRLCGRRCTASVCTLCLRIHGLDETVAQTPTLTGTTSIHVRRPLYARYYEHRWYDVVWDGARRPEETPDVE